MKRYEQDRALIARRYKQYLAKQKRERQWRSSASTYIDQPKAPGRFRKQDGYDCGRPRCLTCSGSKLLERPSPTEQRARISEREQRMDTECICQGNWRAIVKEYEDLIDREFQDNEGNVYRFFGLVHGSDDYYYGLRNETGVKLVSCVVSLKAEYSLK